MRLKNLLCKRRVPNVRHSRNQPRSPSTIPAYAAAARSQKNFGSFAESQPAGIRIKSSLKCKPMPLTTNATNTVIAPNFSMPSSIHFGILGALACSWSLDVSGAALACAMFGAVIFETLGCAILVCETVGAADCCVVAALTAAGA